MPYKLIHFSPGLVELEVTGHIGSEDVAAMRAEGETALRHATEPFDAIVDATGFTGLNPLALAELRELPTPPTLRAVAVVLKGWQLLASKALPRIEGMAFVGSVAEARATLPELSPLKLDRGEQTVAQAPPTDAPLPQLRRLPARPLPAAHRWPAAHNDGAGSLLRGLAGRLNQVARQLEQLRNW
jgi:hypothetical protein